MQLFKNIMQLLIGLIIIVFIAYNRFLRHHKPQLFLDVTNKPFMLILSLLLTLIFGFVSLYLINSFIYKNTLINSNNIFSNTYNRFIPLLTFLRESPTFFYEALTAKRDLRKFVELPASYLTAYFNYPRAIVLIFYFLPPVIVALFFFFEVFYFHQRVYFFKSLTLLILPLLTKVIFFIFKHYSNRRLKNFSLFLDVTYEKEGVYLNLKPIHLLPKNISTAKILAQYNSMCDYWYVYSEIYSFCTAIEEFQNKYKLYFQLLTSILFFSGWLYCFYFFTKCY